MSVCSMYGGALSAVRAQCARSARVVQLSRRLALLETHSPHHGDLEKGGVRWHTLVCMQHVASVQNGEEPFCLGRTSTQWAAKDSFGKWKH